MAAGESARADGARSQDPRGARPARHAADQAVIPTPRSARRVLDEKAARLAAGDLLSRHAWTQRELSARLRRRGAPADVAARVVADLTTRGYLDDAAFARQWVVSRAPRGYGAARLRAELRQRGVASPLIDTALAVLDRDAVLEEARAVARRRMSALKRFSTDKAGARLRDHLLRRGYAASVVSRVLREALGRALED